MTLLASVVLRINLLVSSRFGETNLIDQSDDGIRDRRFFILIFPSHMVIITECSFIFNRKYFFQRHKYPVFFIRRAYILCRIFHVLQSVLHSIAISAVIQHFYIISSISEGSALLRRNPPAFCKSFKAGSLMTSRYDQVNISLFCHFLSLFCHLRRYSKGVYPVSSRKILPK